MSFCRISTFLQKKKCHFVELVRFFKKSKKSSIIFIRLKRHFWGYLKLQNVKLALYFWNFRCQKRLHEIRAKWILGSKGSKRGPNGVQMGSKWSIFIRLKRGHFGAYFGPILGSKLHEIRAKWKKWQISLIFLINIYKAKTGPFWGQKRVILGPILGPKLHEIRAKPKLASQNSRL